MKTASIQVRYLSFTVCGLTDIQTFAGIHLYVLGMLFTYKFLTYRNVS
jgi:hypothetical protein